MRILTSVFVIAVTCIISFAADPPNKPARTKVAILLFPGVELLDFAGPGEAFAAADDADGNDLFEVYTVGLKKESIKQKSGVSDHHPAVQPGRRPHPGCARHSRR